MIESTETPSLIEQKKNAAPCFPSAAVDEALRQAGVQLYGSPYSNPGEKVNMKHTASISGVGDTAIEAALVAICRALGYRGKVRIIRG